MLLPVLRPNSVSSCISHVARTCGEPTENGGKPRQTATQAWKARTVALRRAPMWKVAENGHFLDGGEGWIRTSVRLRGQIYSLQPLTTRPPLQGAGRRAMWRRADDVSTRVNALHKRRCRSPLRFAAGAPISHLPPAGPKLERVKGIEPSS